jgi:hypothetical protein
MNLNACISCYCRAGTVIASIHKIITMKKILIGALVCAAVAGVVYYLSDPEKFNDTVGDLKKKATDTFDKVKDGMSKAQRTAAENA